VAVAVNDANDTKVRRVTGSKESVATTSFATSCWTFSLRDVQRLQVSGFGPRGGRGSKHISWRAEVRFTAELGAVLVETKDRSLA
jgi:hypothetical protein